MKKRTEQSLLEQMKITNLEMTNRLQLVGFTDKDRANLISFQSIIHNEVTKVVNDFYQDETSIVEVAMLIGDSDTLSRLHNMMRGYVIDLFAGYYDLEYVNNRLRIGQVHKRIGVEPKLYLAAMKTLQEHLVRYINQSNFSEHHKQNIIHSLEKLLCFDTTLVFDAYVSSLAAEIDQSRDKVESYAHSLEMKVVERTQELEELARHDPLTGLFNQRVFYEYLRRDLLSAERKKQTLTLLYFDVDNFKGLNDRFGHQKGDDVLRSVAELLTETCREIDVHCRYGGDEFCVILPDCNASQAVMVASRIMKAFEKLHDGMSLSIGIADAGPGHYCDSAELVRRADTMMYSAKQSTGSKYCTYIIEDTLQRLESTAEILPSEQPA